MTDPSPRERALVEPYLKTLNENQLQAFIEIMRLCAASERIAVLAERERCAKVAEGYFDKRVDLGAAGGVIAAAIRKDPS